MLKSDKESSHDFRGSNPRVRGLVRLSLYQIIIPKVLSSELQLHRLVWETSSVSRFISSLQMIGTTRSEIIKLAQNERMSTQLSKLYLRFASTKAQKFDLKHFYFSYIRWDLF